MIYDEDDIYDAVRKYRDSHPEDIPPGIVWARKKEEVLCKFREEFVKGKYLYDATFHSIVHSLIAGANPYHIIEQLIDDRERMYQVYIKSIK